MRNLVRPFFAISCAALIAAFAAPARGQGMGSRPGDMPRSDAMDRMDSSSSELHGTDREFVMDAARGGMAEVEFGKLAVSKSANPDVKTFGQRMIDDHTKANEQLRRVASAKGVSLPTDLDRKSRAEYKKLDQLSGSQFDRAYAELMVKDHEKDLADFNREAKRSGDPNVQQFASTTLPVLQDHLGMARDLQSKVESGSTGPGMHP